MSYWSVKDVGSQRSVSIQPVSAAIGSHLSTMYLEEHERTRKKREKKHTHTLTHTHTHSGGFPLSYVNENHFQLQKRKTVALSSGKNNKTSAAI